MNNAMIDTKLHSTLAYLGALPFVACAVLPWVGVSTIPGIGECAYVSATYGLAIASFMAGVHWGTYLYRAGSLPVNLLLTSNAVTLAVWFAFLLAPVTASLAVNAAAFLVLLVIDQRLARAGHISAPYLQLRRNVTLIVIASLILTILYAMTGT